MQNTKSQFGWGCVFFAGPLSKNWWDFFWNSQFRKYTKYAMPALSVFFFYHFLYVGFKSYAIVLYIP